MTTAQVEHTFTPDTYPADCTRCPFPAGHRVHKLPDQTAEGRRLKDEGTTTALHNAGDWSPAATRALRDLAATGEGFTADDVVARVGLPRGTAQNANNALGGLFAGASRAGLIVRTGDMVESRRREGHARRITVWRGATS